MKISQFYLVSIIYANTFLACSTKNESLINDPPPNRMVEVTSTVSDTTIYEAVDQFPEFSGGMPLFYSYIQNNLKYPEEAKKQGIEGKVFIEFVITKNGRVDAVRVLKGIGALCDEAAIELVASSPDWQPGIKDGKAVNVKLVIPITFKMN